MGLSDYAQGQGSSKPNFAAAIAAHKQAGTINQTVKFYPKTIGVNALAPQDTTVKPADMPFWERTSDSFRALTAGEISLKDVAKQVPHNAVGVANAISSPIVKFFDTTGSIFGEGLAYAFDKNVRDQYKAGNLDILPTVTNTTQAKLAKYTIAAGIETALFRGLPIVAKQGLMARGGLGALEGMGFAFTHGLAEDKTPEEIIKSLPEYGIPGAVLNVVAPYLAPLLSTEVKFMPKAIKNVFKNVSKEAAKPPVETLSRKLGVTSATPAPTAIPVSTPNSRYHSYLRSQGYEPYIPEGKLPSVDVGAGPKTVPDKSAIDIQGTNLPKVSGPDLQHDPQYLHPDQMPVIDYKTGNVIDNAPPKAKVDTRDIKVVPINDTPPIVSKDITPTSKEITQTNAAETIPRPQQTEFKSGVTPDTQASTVPVSQNQLPVGTGATKTSRLEQRMRAVTEDPQAPKLKGEKAAEYQAMTKSEQMSSASKYVESNQDEAMAVLRGEKEAPQGLLHNSIALAMAKQAENTGDSALAIRLASLRSTRAGQEISMLSEADPSSPISAIESIIKARKAAVGRRVNKTLKTDSHAVSEAQKVATNTVKEAKQQISSKRLKIAEAEQLLNDILC